MSNCVGCKTQVVSSKCIGTELELSFKHDGFEDILTKFDEKTLELRKILEAKVDKRFIKTEHVNITEYIQDLINEVDILSKKVNGTTEAKYEIISPYVTGEKTITQLLNIIFKKLETLDKKQSSSYV